jgi:hypothetical protein
VWEEGGVQHLQLGPPGGSSVTSWRDFLWGWGQGITELQLQEASHIHEWTGHPTYSKEQPRHMVCRFLKKNYEQWLPTMDYSEAGGINPQQERDRKKEKMKRN